jgi:hypothetical protein
MGFQKKKAEAMNYSQADVSELASEALRKMRATRVRLPLRFTLETPLLMQRWTTKAVRQMLGNMVGQKQPKTDKDLTKDFEESWYRNEKGVAALPCRIIKACIIEGAISTNGVVTKADLKRSLRVLGYTSPLHDAEQEMDVRIVRNATGGPDVRSRARFGAGAYFDAVLEFGMPLSPDKVISAVEAAGQTIGLCEWRPEKGGELGTFRVDVLKGDAATINRILKECSIPEEEFVIPPEMLRAFNTIPTEELKDGARKVRALGNHQQAQKNGRTNGTAEA